MIMGPFTMMEHSFLIYLFIYFSFSLVFVLCFDSFGGRQFPDVFDLPRRRQGGPGRRALHPGSIGGHPGAHAFGHLLLVTRKMMQQYLCVCETCCCATGVISQASVMDVTDTDRCKGLSDPPVWLQYRRLLKEAEGRDVPL